MMVSKVAVIALVAIVACPILMGYALNLQQVTEYGYEVSGESINVTPLLQDGTAYSYAHADIYNLNTRFRDAAPFYESNYTPTYPTYSLTNSKTSFPVNQIKVANWYPTDPTYFADFNTYHYIAEYDKSVGYLFIQIQRTELPHYGYQALHELYYDKATNSVYGSYYATPDQLAYFHHDKVEYFQLTKYGTFTADTRLYYVLSNTPATTYVNIAAGYYLNQYNDYTPGYDRTYLSLPDNPKNVLMTVDLNTVSAANSSFYIVSNITSTNYIQLVKTTDSGGVHWKLYDGTSADPKADLYYDPARSNNAYQIYFDLTGYQLRYVGDWPTMIGAANYYITYNGTWNTYLPDFNLANVYIQGDSPLFRVDDSEYRAMEYSIIEDKTYYPGQFQNNPSTKISNIVAYGDSITFGGNTYTVTDGKIRLGSRDIPVDNLILSSSPAEGSGYENKIGNTLISITAQPSSIIFNGQWSASIATTAQSEVSYTKTEWTPGQFGWNGIDQNFLMVGLLTSIGVFIAVGIYIRRTKANLWPLLIVCGGAAMLFFCML